MRRDHAANPAIRRGLVCACLLVAAGWGLRAHATVDVLLRTNIIYVDPQAESYCYTRVPVSAELGILPAVVTEATLRPAYAVRSATAALYPQPDFVEINGITYENINVLAQGALIKHTYLEDRITSAGTLEYEAQLDLTDLAALNGDSLAGRQQTVTVAKLALLAIAKNLKDFNGKYRMWITFVGLPDQDGLSGEPLYSALSNPYSGGSPVLAAYESELVDPMVCGTDSAVYGYTKADDTGAQTVDQAGGCSTAGGHGPGAAGLLLLAGLALGLLIRRG